MADKTKKKTRATKAAANGKPKKKRAPRPKQPYLPGAEDMAPPSVPAIDEAAEDYRIAKKAHKEATDAMQQAAANVLRLMHQHSLNEEYEYNGHILRISTLEKVSLKKQKAKDAETAGSNGDE